MKIIRNLQEVPESEYTKTHLDLRSFADELAKIKGWTDFIFDDDEGLFHLAVFTIPGMGKFAPAFKITPDFVSDNRAPEISAELIQEKINRHL